MRKNYLDAKKIIIKVGTSTLTYPNGKLNLLRIERLSMVISDLINKGKEVVLVSSGAIGVGATKLGFSEKPESVCERQASAAIGQAALMQIYQSFFSNYNIHIAQILLTKEDTYDNERRQNAINTFRALMRYGVLPIVNANDTISTDEIGFSDNDNLSAVVAVLLEADLLVILTDIDALYDKNPKEFPDAKPIHEVHEINDEIINMAGDKGSSFGTGGMLTKISAASLCLENGVDMAIIDGSEPLHINDVIEGQNIGTLFIGGTK